MKTALQTNKVRGYKEEDYPPIPNRMTRFWRKNFLWQIFRFFVLNFKIMKIIVGGHS